MKTFIRELSKAIFVGSCIFIVFLLIMYIRGDFDKGFSLSILWKQYYVNLLYSVAIYMANAYMFMYLLARFNKNLFGPKSFPISLTATIVVSLFTLFIVRFVHLIGFEGMSVQEFWARQTLGNYWVSILITLVVSLVFYGFFFYKYKQESKVKVQKIIAGTASAKFDALKNQLDPHFLFNSLNVLTSLIEENPAQAQKFTTSLSKVYRYVLEQKNKDLVPLDEELRFARLYVQLLTMRFEDSIVFDIPGKSEDPEAKIVPLSLQLLLENAVKHNIVTSSKPLHIKVFEDAGNLVVSNDLQEKKTVKKSSGFGLRNIQQRYGILTDREVSIEKTTAHFVVRLPVLTDTVSVMETQEEYMIDKRYERAKEKVKAIKGFYGNLTSYCLVIPILAYVNYRTTNFAWVFFPILGWGFGLVSHYMEAFGKHPLWGKRWEERKMREFMEDEP